MYNDDNSVNISAVKGAEGIIGLRPAALSSSTIVQQMVDLWRQASSSDCDAGLAYCDADGDPTTWPEYAPSVVDAVLLYAHAMDALRRTAPSSMGDPDALYAAMLNLSAFEGMTGPVHLGPDGDGLGKLALVNLQTCIDGEQGLQSCGGRRRLTSSSISLSSTVMAFVEVGMYDANSNNLTVRSRHARFANSPAALLTHAAPHLCAGVAQ